MTVAAPNVVPVGTLRGSAGFAGFFVADNASGHTCHALAVLFPVDGPVFGVASLVMPIVA